jgi:ADP-ribose pyrophosphatase
MEKPQWRLRASRYVVDSPYMRLRMDEVELPNGTIVPNYYVRESRGYCVVVALTEDGCVVLVRQYRYGSDAIHLELPAGLIDEGEEPLECAPRELAEETGYEAERFEKVGEFLHEPVRSNARAYVYIASGARKTLALNLDPTEHLTVELAPLGLFRRMLADGRIDAGGSIAAGYLALDKLRAL